MDVLRTGAELAAGRGSEAEQHSDTPLAILAVVRKLEISLGRQITLIMVSTPCSALTELFSLKDLLISFQFWKIEFCFWLFEGDVEEVYETSKKLVDNPRLELMKVSSHTKHFTQFLLLF